MSKQIKIEPKLTKEMIKDSFYDYQCVEFDHKTAILADLTKQRYGIDSRPYYVDITYKCSLCKKWFTFEAKEQKVWYEEYGFWNTAHPVNCVDCRKKVRHEKNMLIEFSSYKKEDDKNLSSAEAKHLCELMITVYQKPFSLKLQERFNLKRV